MVEMFQGYSKPRFVLSQKERRGFSSVFLLVTTKQRRGIQAKTTRYHHKVWSQPEIYTGGCVFHSRALCNRDEVVGGSSHSFSVLITVPCRTDFSGVRMKEFVGKFEDSKADRLCV